METGLLKGRQFFAGSEGWEAGERRCKSGSDILSEDYAPFALLGLPLSSSVLFLEVTSVKARSGYPLGETLRKPGSMGAGQGLLC